MLLQSSETDMEINYFVEDWEGQNNFHYLSDYATIDHENCNVFTTNHDYDFNVFMASPAVKAKFKYPTRDPMIVVILKRFKIYCAYGLKF